MLWHPPDTQALLFAYGWHVEPSLMFAIKIKRLPLSGLPTMTLIASIRLGCEGLQGTNTLTYLPISDEEKKFYSIDTWLIILKKSN
jgi:hypothetical protein